MKKNETSIFKEFIETIKQLPVSAWIYFLFLGSILYADNPYQPDPSKSALVLTLVFGLYWILKARRSSKQSHEFESLFATDEKEKRRLMSRKQSVKLHHVQNSELLADGYSPIHLILNQREDGTVYFNKNYAQEYVLTLFNWSGAEYKEVVTVKQASSKPKYKTTGRIKGAFLGTMISPGTGTILGAMIGTGSKRVDSKKSQAIKRVDKIEIDTPATLTVFNLHTKKATSFSFPCNSELNSKIKSLTFKVNEKPKEKILNGEKEKIELIKQYKTLLDSGIITKEEFLQKRKELINL